MRSLFRVGTMVCQGGEGAEPASVGRITRVYRDAILRDGSWHEYPELYEVQWEYPERRLVAGYMPDFLDVYLGPDPRLPVPTETPGPGLDTISPEG